jgi:hypothetical protein
MFIRLGYGLEMGFDSRQWKVSFSSEKCADWLLDPSNLSISEHRSLFPLV